MGVSEVISTRREVDESEKSRRVQLRLSEKAFGFLETMKDFSGSTTKVGFIEKALSLYSYLLQRRREGTKVRIFVEESNGNVHEVVLPDLNLQ